MVHIYQRMFYPDENFTRDESKERKNGALKERGRTELKDLMLLECDDDPKD